MYEIRTTIVGEERNKTMSKAKLVFVIQGDQSDLEFLQSGLEGKIEEHIEDERELGRFDSDIEVDWEILVGRQRLSILED